MRSEAQQALFDVAQGAEPDSCVLFLAVPTGHPDRDGLIDAVSDACGNAARRVGLSLTIMTGEDLNTRDPAHVADRQREVMMNEVDAAIVVHGPSWGCSREYNLAGESLIPRYLGVPDGIAQSAARGPDGVGLEARGGFRSTEELASAVGAWLEAYAVDIRSRRRRRGAPRVLTESLRKPTLRAWKIAPRYEHERIARLLGYHWRQIEKILMSEIRYAEARIGSMLVLANELGTWSMSTPAPSVGRGLTGQELRAFTDASSLLELSDDDAAALLAVGTKEKQKLISLEMAGRPARRSLRSRNAWLALWPEL